MSLLNPKQIDLKELFSVRHTLNSHGFEVDTIEDKRETVLPLMKWSQQESELIYKIFDDEAARKELLYRINDKNFQVSKPEVNELVSEMEFFPEIKRYYTTFEWYFGELMIRKFGAFAAAYGVQVKNVLEAGSTVKDIYYDVLVVQRSTNLMYMKFKTAEFTKDEVIKCITEGLELFSETTIMFVKESIGDAKLRMNFRFAKHPVSEKAELKKIWVGDKHDDAVYEWNNFYLVQDSGNIEEKLRIIMRLNASKKASWLNFYDFKDEDYKKLGYDCQKVF